MPIYGYRCGSCGHEFEILQKMSDPPLTACPKCAGKLSKMMYAAGVIYKGSGYYSTDYKGSKSAGGSSDKSSDTSSAGTSDKGDSNGAATSSEGSGGDSKPAAESKSESNASKSDSSTEKAS